MPIPDNKVKSACLHNVFCHVGRFFDSEEQPVVDKKPSAVGSRVYPLTGQEQSWERRQTHLR